MNAALLAGSTVATLALQIVWQVALARALGGAGYGTYATIGALLVMGAAIAEFGMGLVVIRDVAARRREAGRYLAATLGLQPLLAGAAYGALAALAWGLGYAVDLRALLAFAAVSLLVDVFGNMCHNQLVAAERMRVPAVAAPAHSALLIALGLPILAAGGGLWGVYAAGLAAGLIRSMGYWLALRSVGGRPAFPVDLDLTRYLLREGWPIAALSAVALATRHVDKLIVTALLGPAATGELTTALLVVFAAIEVLSTPVLVAVLPLLSRLQRQGGAEALAAPLGTLVTLAVASGLPVVLLGFLLAQPLAAGLFGPAFGEAAGVLRLLIWSVLPALVVNVFAQILLVESRQRDLLRLRTLGLAAHVVLLLVLIPRMGIIGAAVAAIATEMLVLSLLLTRVRLGAAWWRRLAPRILRLGGAALPTAAIVLLLRPTYPLLAGIAGALVAAGALLAPGTLLQTDRRLLQELRSSLWAGIIAPGRRSKGL